MNSHVNSSPQNASIFQSEQGNLKRIQSEVLFRALIENIHDAVVMYDKDFITLYRSPSVTRMLGYSDKERLNKRLNLGIHKEDVQIMERHISEVLENPGKSFPFEIRTKHKAGHYVWIEGVTTNLFENKSVNAIVSNFRDITERKIAEEALLNSEHRFKSLIENSEDLITLIDTTGKLTYVSPSVERVLGYTSEETIGHSPMEIIHPEDLQNALDILQKVLENPGKPVWSELRNRKKDGGYIWLSGTITNMLDVPGVNAVVANTRDITQRKIAEDLTRRSEALLAEAQHIANYGNWNLDISSGILSWSEELFNVFGINKKPPGLTFNQLINLVDEEDREFVREVNRHILLTGEPFDVEYRITTDAGEKRVIHSVGYAEYSSDGRVKRVYGTAQNISETKHAQEELLKEKELSDNIINSLTGIFYLLNNNGNFLRWNKNAETVSGYNGDEISKMHALDFFDEDEKEMIDKKIAEVFSKGKAEAEAHLFTKGKDKIPYFFKATLADFEGEHCLIGIAVDITDRKEKEATIKASEAKFRAFFETSLDAILFLTPEGQILEANPAAKEIFEISELDIISSQISKFVDPKDKRLKHIIKESYQSGRSKGELMMLRSNGTKFPCEIASVTYKNALNEERVNMIIRDITERKLAEERLLQINERYKMATRATSNAIWDWNLRTNEMFWSEGYELTFGYTIGDNPESFDSWIKKIHPEDSKRVRESVVKAISGNGGIFWSDEYRFIKADGTVAYVFDRGNIMYDEQNKPVRFLGAMQDITATKEIETERELLINELMKTNADLRQFSYITSHNLRAPLSNIESILNIIEYHDLGATNSELIRMLKVSCKQLTTTINDLSNILIIKNNINVEITTINLADTLREINNTFMADLESVGGTIITDLKIREVSFHKTYLESIFVNLISNAIKYRSSHRNLVIRVSTRKDEYGRCVLKLSDNGVGIDLRRHKDKVFGLYQRFHSEIEGHGIGLFIIKSQITALGGNIEIESEEDKGTSFIITFKNKAIKRD